jgi:DNA-binding CsgD family transcriptional regulator
VERALATPAEDGSFDEEVAWVMLDGYSALAASEPDGRIEDAGVLSARIAELFDRFPGTPYEGIPWLSERLLPLAGWLVARSPHLGEILIPSMDRALARADSGSHSVGWKTFALAFREGDVQAWRNALALTEEGRMPAPYVHLARLKLAEALIADGDRVEASTLLERVIAEAPTRGATLVANWAQAVARRAGLSIAAEDAAPRAAVVLTPRERQVLALVAEGLTNPQIGARLYISPKTASVHVSAILTKIGAANRTEAAAIYSASLTPQPAAVVSP